MKKLLYITLILDLTLAVWYSCKDNEKLLGELYGVVTDKATGKQIKTAGVELQPVGLKTVTGTGGQYGFNEIEPSKYKLYITKTGYADWLSNSKVYKYRVGDGKSPYRAHLELAPPMAVPGNVTLDPGLRRI